MRVLILDDDPARDEPLKARYLEATQHVIVRTVDDALAAVASESFDVATLDHDLGYDRTGLDFVRALLALDRSCWPARACVHSMNPVGAQQMAYALHAAGIRTIKWPCRVA